MAELEMRNTKKRDQNTVKSLTKKTKTQTLQKAFDWSAKNSIHGLHKPRKV